MGAVDNRRKLAVEIQNIVNDLPSGKDVSDEARLWARTTLQRAADTYRHVRGEINVRLAYMISECQSTLGYDEFVVLLNAAKGLLLALARELLDT